MHIGLQYSQYCSQPCVYCSVGFSPLLRSSQDTSKCAFFSRQESSIWGTIYRGAVCLRFYHRSFLSRSFCNSLLLCIFLILHIQDAHPCSRPIISSWVLASWVTSNQFFVRWIPWLSTKTAALPSSWARKTCFQRCTAQCSPNPSATSGRAFSATFRLRKRLRKSPSGSHRSPTGIPNCLSRWMRRERCWLPTISV